MKCTNCGSRIDGLSTSCPFCGVLPDSDRRRIHFHDLVADASMACPRCTTPLGVIEFETEPRVRIERCTTCQGMFFNPGEFEEFLEARVNPLSWLDPDQIHEIADDLDHQREVFYQKCPACSERMSHINFGGRSGVIVDRCGTHGIWIGGSKVRRLAEWWLAGGKLIYQQNEADRAKLLHGSTEKGKTITSPDSCETGTWNLPDPFIDPSILIDLIFSAASTIFED